MAYPEAIDTFVEKLNKADIVYVIEDEELILENGVFEGELAHDNVKNESVMVFTEPKMSGERIENFFLSIPTNAPWKRIIKVFANVPKVYVTYETTGDQVEAEDINRVQDSIVNTQKEVERYKAANDQAVSDLGTRLSTVESKKADKTYVDTELLKKADKENTYTKAETDSRIQAKVDAHANRTDNPHSVTKSQVGLGNVANYGIATQAEAEAGSVNNKYMTPLRVKQAINVLQAVKSVAGKTGNVTLTKDDVGLSNVDNIKQAGKTEFDSHNNDTTRHITAEERTRWNNKAEVSQIPTKVSQLENDENFVTQEELEDAGYGDMRKAVYDTNNDGIVDNADKLDGYHASSFVLKTGDTMTGDLKVAGNVIAANKLAVGFNNVDAERFRFEYNGSSGRLELWANSSDSGTWVKKVEFPKRQDDNDFSLLLGGNQVWHAGNFDPNTKLNKGPLTWNQLKGVI